MMLVKRHCLVVLCIHDKCECRWRRCKYAMRSIGQQGPSKAASLKAKKGGHTRIIYDGDGRHGAEPRWVPADGEWLPRTGAGLPRRGE